MTRLSGRLSSVRNRRLFLVAIGCAVVLFVFIFGYWRSTNEQVSTEAIADAESAHASPVSLDQPSLGNTPSSSLTLGDGFQRSTTDSDLEVVDPGNPREIDWSRRNLAYSQTLLERVRTDRQPLSTINPDDGFSLEELAAAYEGAVDAQVLPEQRGLAIELLEEAATQGSIAALSTLAQIYASGEHRAPVEAEAHFRLAEMRGDWSVSFRHGITDQLYSLSPAEHILASLRAQEILATINGIRFQRGQPPLGVDPRPGLERAMQTIRADFERQSSP